MTEVPHGFGHASTLGDHVRVLRRRKWIVIVTTIVVTALALFMSSRQGTVYRASAQVLINQVSPGYAVVGGIPRNDPTREAFSQSVIASGPLVAERVARLPEFRGRTLHCSRRRVRLLGRGLGSAHLPVDSVDAGVRRRARQCLREAVPRVSPRDTTRSLRELRLKIEKQLDDACA